MARVTFASKLPANTRAELDQRIRQAGYGDLVKIADWLTRKGFPVTKSAVHTHSCKLKAIDAAAPAGLRDQPPETQRAFIELAQALYHVHIAWRQLQAVTLPEMHS